MPLFLGVARASLGLQKYAYSLSAVIAIVALTWWFLRRALVGDKLPRPFASLRRPSVPNMQRLALPMALALLHSVSLS